MPTKNKLVLAVLFNYSHLVDFVSFFIRSFCRVSFRFVYTFCFCRSFRAAVDGNRKQAVDKTNSQIHHLLSNICFERLDAQPTTSNE